jgi:hypothetical protein
LPEQNYSNHRQTVPAFHFFLLPVLLLTLIGSLVNLYKSWGDHERFYSAALIVVLSFCVLLAALLSRMFALKAQDRAIRAEENLRHFVLTGKLLDARLSIRQVIALRFAVDSEPFRRFVGVSDGVLDFSAALPYNKSSGSLKGESPSCLTGSAPSLFSP